MRVYVKCIAVSTEYEGGRATFRSERRDVTFTEAKPEGKRPLQDKKGFTLSLPSAEVDDLLRVGGYFNLSFNPVAEVDVPE